VPRFRYTGQIAIPEAQLYYYKARLYDPVSGKFLQTDPVGDQSDLNLYAYVQGDPVDGSDPSGGCPLSICKYGESGSGAPDGGTPEGVVDDGSLASGTIMIAAAINTPSGTTAASDKNAHPTTTQAKTPYTRPSNATTPAQRASVQGQPCAKCGGVSSPMYAGHKKDLVVEHHETGRIDINRMRSVEAVHPERPNCSNRSGGFLSNFSKLMNKIIRANAESARLQAETNQHLSPIEKGFEFWGEEGPESGKGDEP
jgi:RHS repeat-associated protein